MTWPRSQHGSGRAGMRTLARLLGRARHHGAPSVARAWTAPNSCHAAGSRRYL